MASLRHKRSYTGFLLAFILVFTGMRPVSHAEAADPSLIVGWSNLSSGQIVSGVLNPGPELQTSDTSKVQKVAFHLLNTNGQVVQTRTESVAKYCASGGDTQCGAWRLHTLPAGSYTLRATLTTINNTTEQTRLSFILSGTGNSTWLPDAAPARNVLDYGAIPDDGKDDTAAIQATIDSTYNAWEQIYIPQGTYNVSDEISWGRFLTLRGDGPGKTILKLKDQASGYQSKSSPKAVLFCRLNGKDSANNNTSHSNYILNMTVDVGTNNPGAIGIDYTSHNGGAVKNVEIRAGKNAGLTGISMERDSPGPAIIKSVIIRGFDVGIAVNWGLYGMTFEDITLKNQRRFGFQSNAHPASIRNLVSYNTVPAIKVADNRDYGVVVVLDSHFHNGGSDQNAIDSDGEVFVRNVRSSGYAATLRDGSQVIQGTIKEYSSSPLLKPDGTVGRSLNLPIEAAPYVPWESDANQWANVADYQDRMTDPDDWSPAIQAAIDSGKSTVFFPNFTHSGYATKNDIYVRGKVKRIVGLWARFENKLIFNNTQHVVVEQLRADGGYEIRGSGSVALENSLGGTIYTASGKGKLFLEDYCCGRVSNGGSKIWARQLNIEQSEWQMKNAGGQLWVLGMKTEQNGKVLGNQNQARSEILGGMIYPAQGTSTYPMYSNDATSMFTAVHREIGATYPDFLILDGQAVNPDFTYGVRFTMTPQ